MRALPGVAFEPRRMERATVNRQSLVRIEGTPYSLQSNWKHLEVEAWVGAEDIRFCCRGVSQTVERKPRSGRQVRYRDYLSELAKKPQAVRQVAPELVAELGPPYGPLWESLCETHGELKGARVLAGLLAAMVQLGEDPVREAVQSALEAGRCDLLTLGRRLYPQQVRRVAVPEALVNYSIEAVQACDFDHLLMGGES